MPRQQAPLAQTRTPGLTVAVWVCLVVCLVWVRPVRGQPLQDRDRVGTVRQQRTATEARKREQALEQEAAQREAVALAELHARLGMELRDVVLDRLPGKAALEWLKRETGLPMVVHWPALEAMGIDPRTPVTFSLESVPAARVLDLMLDQLDRTATTIDPQAKLIYDITPWYVHILTKADANRRPVPRVYDVASAVMVTPHFDQPPEMDLGSILSDASGFTVDAPDDEPPLTREERGQRLADIIRDTIEPTIWQGNGGAYSSVRYHDGRLIVNAPMYVHRQIGMPVVGGR